MKFKSTFLIAGMMIAASTTAKAQLVINELMQSNVEYMMDDIKEFPDSWVELYNKGTEAVNLKDYKISNKKKPKKAWQLPDMTVEPNGFVVIFCDKEGKEDNRLHADFRLESGKDGNLYLFKDGDDNPIDMLEGMAKMPAPDVAYGRKTDGGDEWGYQLTPSAGKPNTGDVCDAKHILGAPIFSEPGRVTSGKGAISLELSLPEGAPEGAFITYTTNGSEPTASDKKYTQAISITKTTAIRAKVFCEGWLSPMSTAQSYIFHPRAMTVPIFSVQTNDKYLNDASLGLFANNNSKEDKKLHDWRRPVNIEFFPSEDENSAFNQIAETRIQGGASRANALKSMVFYANKRFDPDHKRFSYEFFPDQKPGITEFKSFSLRDGGNDFGDMYFRDLIIQRTMASHVDLDWQAGHTAVLYINGEYMGMLNIRERSNEDNIYSNYDGLEDLDVVEIGHEQINGNNMFEEEFKEGTADFYEQFKAFYSEKRHSMEEYEKWIDVNEYLNVIAMNFFYGNIDFPGNNLVFWRPNDDAVDCPLPKRWRVIVKDTDFGLGLYGRKPDFNTIDLLYNPQNHQDSNWAFTEPATRLLKNMLEDPDILKLFINKCCLFMGDFMNGKGTGEIIDLIKDEAMEEFVAHRDKFKPGWGWWAVDNSSDIENKFAEAKRWAENRPNNFYRFIGDQWKNLGKAIPVTINKGNSDKVESVTVNDYKLSKGVFDGKLFPSTELYISSMASGDNSIVGWRVIYNPSTDNEEIETFDGNDVTFILKDCKSATIEPIFKVGTGIQTIKETASKADNAAIYDLLGNKVTTPKAGRIYIRNGKKETWR